VTYDRRAAAGVGCLINKNITKNIRKWEGHSERILTVELNIDDKIATVITVYGPNEDETAEMKDKFWEQLSLVTESCKGNIYVAGDMNSRVGKNAEGSGVIGRHGEDKKTNNGTRLMEYCLLNNLILTNTFYEHKNIHKYTRQGTHPTDKSIIDYIMVEKHNRDKIRDVRIMRGPEIYSDHYMLVAKIKKGKKENTNVHLDKKTEIEYETIKSYKLRENNIAKKYKELIKCKVEKQNTTNKGVEELWRTLKEIIIESAREACGTIKVSNKLKQTAWWNEEIKHETKIKKEKWKKYLQQRSENNYNDYKAQRTKVKNMVREEKEASWIKFGEKMETNSKDNQKLFYKILKNTRNGKPRQSTTIKNKVGEIITEDEAIMERWKEYFQDLLCIREERNNRNEENNTPEENEEMEPITLKETTEVIKALKNGKTPGHDKITAEMMKNMGQEGIELFAKVCQKAWEEGLIPIDWQVGIIVPIHKNGDIRDCNNYRGITLLSTALKTYERILENKLKRYTETTLDEAQSGFRRGRSVHDHIFTIKQLIQKALTSKSKGYFAFIDMEKAFDRVRRETIWESLTKRRVNNKLIRAIKSIYKVNTNYIISKNRISDKFETKEGLRQGGVLSPALFNIFIDEIIKTCKPDLNKLHVGFRQLQQITITECAFADDVVIMANTEKGLQSNVNSWDEILKNHGMKINTKKTKVMMTAKEQETMNIKIGEENIEQVTHFKYLGTTIESNGKQEIDINERVQKTIKTYHMMRQNFIKKKEISKKTKITIFKTIYRPILTYGSETWVLTRQMKSKIQAIEMKYLRAVKGITRRDRIRNTEVRKELETKSILEYIEEKQLNWWGHIQRMEDTRLVRRIWEAKTARKRGRGRPRETWDDTIAKNIQKRGKTVNEAKKITQDRKNWKRFVQNEM
jgi:hypothetical protein